MDTKRDTICRGTCWRINLLSHTTENLLRGHLSKDVSLLDLGEHRFKGILESIYVSQVIPPAWRALDI